METTATGGWIEFLKEILCPWEKFTKNQEYLNREAFSKLFLKGK